MGTDIDDEPVQPIAQDVYHFQEHYRDFFSEFEVIHIEPSQQEALFRIVSRAASARQLRIRLTTSCFRIEEDSADGALCGTELESFEQVLSAMDGAEAFGTRMCDLMSAKLAGLGAAGQGQGDRWAMSDDEDDD